MLSVITHMLWNIQSSLSVSLYLLTYMCSICKLGDVTGQSSEDLVQLTNAQKLYCLGKYQEPHSQRTVRLEVLTTVTMTVVVFWYVTRVIS